MLLSRKQTEILNSNRKNGLVEPPVSYPTRQPAGIARHPVNESLQSVSQAINKSTYSKPVILSYTRQVSHPPSHTDTQSVIQSNFSVKKEAK